MRRCNPLSYGLLHLMRALGTQAADFLVELIIEDLFRPRSARRVQKLFKTTAKPIDSCRLVDLVIIRRLAIDGRLVSYATVKRTPQGKIKRSSVKIATAVNKNKPRCDEHT
jgi:hypothetical protein